MNFLRVERNPSMGFVLFPVRIGAIRVAAQVESPSISKTATSAGTRIPSLLI